MAAPGITWKVVYWGPRGAGKTTCVRVLERRAPRGPGALASIVAHPDHGGCRFEILPVEFAHQGRVTVRIEVFTVPGCGACVATRGLVLQRADAVVFVADAHPARVAANRQAASELVAALRAQGRDPAQVPVVIQVNKRELPQALPAAALRDALRPLGARPVVESVACLGEGVTSTLRRVTRELIARAAGRDDAPAAPVVARPGAAPVDDRSAAAALPPAPAPKRAAKPARPEKSSRAAPAATPAGPASPAKPRPAAPPAGKAAKVAAPAPRTRSVERGRSGRAPALAR